LTLNFQTALVWACNWSMPCLRIFTKVLPIRGFCDIRNWCWKWDTGLGYPQSAPRRLPGCLRANTLQHHRDKREPREVAKEETSRRSPLCKYQPQKCLPLGYDRAVPMLFCSHGSYCKSFSGITFVGSPINQDNFAHDVVRYDMNTLKPYQGLVTISEQGDFDTVYTSVTDPLIASFLDVRRRLQHAPPINKVFLRYETLRKLYATMPFAPNLSPAEYVPTRLLNLLQTLRNYFPRHRLLLSDFSSLPEIGRAHV